MPVTLHVISGIEPGSIFGNGISGSNQWKHCDGIYFISRVKENMVLQSFASNRFDADNELNIGVISDELVGPSSVGVTLRRIAYRDPATQEYDEFITSEMPLAPGLIAQLYRMRWDVEKVYDEVKNRLHEQKAWATSAIAKTMQAQFICMTHHLMALLEAQMIWPRKEFAMKRSKSVGANALSSKPGKPEQRGTGSFPLVLWSEIGAENHLAQCEIREMAASIFVLARELEPRSLCQPRPAL